MHNYKDENQPEPILGIGYSVGPASNTKVKPSDYTWSELKELLAGVSVGEKDGSYFTVRQFTDCHRKSTNALVAHLVVLDGDKSVEINTTNTTEGAPDPLLVHKLLKEKDITHVIYSTHSHGGKGNRYRVVVPHSTKDKEELGFAVDHLIELLHTAGLGVADVVENKDLARLWYLPRVPKESDIKDFVYLDHEGHYQIPKLDKTNNQSFAASIPKIQEAVKSLSVSTNSPIGIFNQEQDCDGIKSMLDAAGYVLEGETEINNYPAYIYLRPGSSSGKAGVKLFKTDKDVWRVYSHHGEDDVLVDAEGAKAHDAFGVFTMLVHSGDMDAALQCVIKDQQPSKADIDILIDAINEGELEKVAQILKKMAAATLLSETEKDSLLKELKNTSGVSMAALRSDLKKYQGESKQETYSNINEHGLDEGSNHQQIAQNMVESHTEDDNGVKPVSDSNQYHRYSDGVWTPTGGDRLESQIARRYFSGMRLCKTAADHRSISYICKRETHTKDYFYNAPVGVALRDKFLTLDGNGKVKQNPLSQDHRQKLKFNFDYSSSPEHPKWTKFLHDCFSGNDCDNQIKHMQEVFGAVLLRMMPSLQVAIMLYGVGASGKSTALQVLESLIPSHLRSSVSPLNWGDQYYKAQLAGVHLNVCGELDSNKFIPASEFKKVIGGDSVEGRQPGGRVFFFRNEAAHIFNTNHYPQTRERSDAFFRRWRILEFSNTVPTARRVLDYAKVLLETEQEGIVSWAIAGAARLAVTGKFTSPEPHTLALGDWRVKQDSVRGFLHDGIKHKSVVVTGNSDDWISNHALYEAYSSYCNEEGRAPLGKHKFIRIMDTSSGFSEINKIRDAIKGRGYTGLCVGQMPPILGK